MSRFSRAGRPLVRLPFLIRGWRSFRTMRLNMFSLIGTGVAAAYAFSVIVVIAPGLFPSDFRDHSGQVGVYSRPRR